MSERDKREAAQHAARAAKQMKHAAKNTGSAAEAAAEHAKDEVVEAADKTREGVKELAQKMIYTETGRGILALGLAGVTAVIGVRKLQEATRISQKLKENLAAVEPLVSPEDVV